MRLPGPIPVQFPHPDQPATSLYRYVWRLSGWHQAGLALLAVLIAGLGLVPLELQRRIVNDAIDQQNHELLLLLGGTYAGVVIAQATLKYALRMYQGWVSESAIKNSRERLAQIDEARRTASSPEGPGKAVSVIGNEVDQLGGFVGNAVSDPLVNGGNVLAVFVYMMVIEPQLAAASLIFLVPQFITVPLLQRLVNRLVEKRIGLLRRLNELIAGGGQQAADDGQPSEEVRSMLQIYRNRMRTYGLKFASKSLVNLFNGAAPVAALVVGGYLVIDGQTSIGTVVAFISGFERIADPVRQLITFYSMASQIRVRFDMIARWM